MKQKKNCRQRSNLWNPGEPLTKKDRDLLSVLVRKYEQLGYVPAQREVPNAAAIKKRFRIWKDAVAAAGLPRQNSPDQTHIRMKKQEWEKRINGL